MKEGFNPPFSLINRPKNNPRLSVCSKKDGLAARVLLLFLPQIKHQLWLSYYLLDSGNKTEHKLARINKSIKLKTVNSQFHKVIYVETHAS